MSESHRLFGSFRPIEVLTRGAHSILLRAEHLETGVPVVIKRVETASPACMAAFLREISFLKTLSHPGVVRLLADGILEGKPWFALEPLEASSLPAFTSVVSSGPAHPAPPPTAHDATLRPFLTLFLRLAETVLYLERSGIVHRDIKPDNILLRHPEQPVLIDFGLAARSARTSGREVLEIGGGVVGSSAFMPPEQLLGEPGDVRSDLYSLGATLVWLLTGGLPFATSHQVLDPACRLGPLSTRVPGLPTALQALLQRLLAKDPKERPQSAAEVTAVLEAMLQPRAPVSAVKSPVSLAHPRMAGRQRELWHLLLRIESLLETRQSELLLILGESGMGKTRLVREVLALLQSRHPRLKLFAGECLPPPVPTQMHASTPPSAAFRDIFRGILEHSLAEGLEESARVLGRRGALLQLFDPLLQTLPGQEGLDPPPYFMPGEARYHLFTTMRATLQALAPVLIVLEDLQWVDPFTLELLRFLTQPAPGHPSVILLGIVRTEAHRAEPPGSCLFPDAWRLPLDPLDAGAMEEIVGDMLGETKIASRVAALVAPVAGGNPLFVAELLRALVAEAVLRPTPEGCWRLEDDASVEALQRLPALQAVQSVIRKRLAWLPEPNRRLLEAASLLDRSFSSALLAEILHRSLSEIDGALSHVVQQQFLVQDISGSHRFPHELVRQAVLWGLSNEEQVGLHRCAAEALERLNPAPDSEQKAALAHHLERAGEPLRARGLYREIAREFLDRHALEAAEQALLAYLHLATDASAERSITWRELGERVYVARGALSSALHAFNQAEQDALAVEDRLQQALARAAHAELLTCQCRFEEALAVMEAVTRQLRSRGDLLVEARIHLRFGAVLTQCWQQKDATASYLAAAGLFRSLEDLRGELMALCGVAHGAALLPEAQAATILPRCTELSRVLEDPGAEAEVHWRYAASFSLCDDWRFLSQLERAVWGLRAAGERRWTIIALAWLVRGRLLCGPGDVLPALKHQVQTFLEITEAPLHRATLLGALGQLLWHGGALESASQHLLEGIQVLEALGDRLMRAHLLHDLARVRADQGREADARLLFEESRSQHPARWPALFMHLQGCICAARLERRTAHLDRAGESLAGALELCAEHKCGPLRLICLCEAVHLALARGERGQQAQEALERCCAESPPAEGGEVAGAVARSRRAMRACAEGEPLWQGESLSDLPTAVLRSIPVG